MSYTMRDWDNTGNEVTKDDFKRIEQGIAANDTAITANAEQSNTAITANAEQINVLSEKVNNMTTIGETDALNGWVKAWTTDTVDAFKYEINGNTIHVKALLGAGTVTTSTIIAVLPKGAKDEWVYGTGEDGLTSKFYLDWSGNLKVNSVSSGTGKAIHLDFSYRKK